MISRDTIYMSINNLTPRYYVKKLEELAKKHGYQVIIEKGTEFYIEGPFGVADNPLEAYALLLRYISKHHSNNRILNKNRGKYLR